MSEPTTSPRWGTREDHLVALVEELQKRVAEERSRVSGLYPLLLVFGCGYIALYLASAFFGTLGFTETQSLVGLAGAALIAAGFHYRRIWNGNFREAERLRILFKNAGVREVL